MKSRHYNIPIFIPEMACPHRCVFCNQQTITGQFDIPEPSDIKSIIEAYLATIPLENSNIQVAFFGGSFTGLPMDLQRNYLAVVQPFLSDRISGIRLSTRPDYIDLDILNMLKSYGVSHIELGAQSMDDAVLRKAGRGHDAAAVFAASQIILSHGFELGLQMMLGLPGDSSEKALATARAIVEAGAKETRIYPTLVVKGTALEKLWRKGKYIPMTLEEAVKQSATIYSYFESEGVKVLRIGLYASEELVNNSGYLAGPFHASFKELVMTEIWRRELDKVTVNASRIRIHVAANQLNHAVGYKKSNLEFLQTKFDSVKFKVDKALKNRDYHVDYL